MFEACGKADILWAEPGGGVWAEPRAPSPPARGSAAALPRPVPSRPSRSRDLRSGLAADGATWESNG